MQQRTKLKGCKRHAWMLAIPAAAGAVADMHSTCIAARPGPSEQHVRGQFLAGLCWTSLLTR